MADDFDAELEEAARQASGDKPVVEGRAKAAGGTAGTAKGSQPSTPAARPASTGGAKASTARPASAAGQQSAPKPMSARKPGFFGRLAEQTGQALSGLKLPRMDINTISYGLLALIALALIIENWAPGRVNIFGFYADLPKALVFLVGMGLGALVLWWIQHYWLRRREAEEQ